MSQEAEGPLSLFREKNDDILVSLRRRAIAYLEYDELAKEGKLDDIVDWVDIGEVHMKKIRMVTSQF